MALISQRNAKMFAKLTGSGYSISPGSPTSPQGIGTSPDVSIWEVPILSGFSFGQTTNSTEVPVNEAGFTSRRGRVMYNDSLAPVEFSFSTYIRPIAGGTPNKVVAPEQVLWAMLMGGDSYNPTSGKFYSSLIANSLTAGNPVSPTYAPGTGPAINSGTDNATGDIFDFSASNISYYPAGNSIIFQIQEGANYEVFTIDNAQIGSVTIDFDIEGICTAQWTGMGTKITRSTTQITGANTVGVNTTTNFIRNKLSTLVLSSYNDANVASPGASAGSPGADSYSIVLTGGSFTIENNISFLTPEVVGIVNQPVANITGTRTISGTLTCYYDSAVGSDKSAELWQDLITGSSGNASGTIPTVRNAHNMTINIGGATGNRLVLSMPTAHLEIPTINPDELFTLEANFHAIPTTGNYDLTNEATVTYAI